MFGSFCLIVMKEPSPLPQWGTATEQKDDQAREEGGQFVKEQQASWMPSARFLKCCQFQRKVAGEKVDPRLFGAGWLPLLDQ